MPVPRRYETSASPTHWLIFSTIGTRASARPSPGLPYSRPSSEAARAKSCSLDRGFATLGRSLRSDDDSDEASPGASSAPWPSRGCARAAGRWYYQVKPAREAKVLGARAVFGADDGRGDGVGDDARSCGFERLRGRGATAGAAAPSLRRSGGLD